MIQIVDVRVYGRNLTDILRSHGNWVKQKIDGVRADLSEASLANVDLCQANLFGADLYGADLCGASLVDADLRKTNLSTADLTNANLTGVALAGADLRYTIGIIDLGTPDGWSAFAWLYNEELRVQVGCRAYSIYQGYRYWSGKKNRREVILALDYARDVATTRGWKFM